MTTDNLSSLVQEVAVERALDALNQPTTPDDTPLLVSSNINEGQRVALISMVDGLPRPPIPRMHAKRVLGKRLADGTPAFWIPGMPGNPPTPVKGSIKCMLHPEFDEESGPAGFGRAFVDEAGLAGFFCNRGDPSKKNVDTFPTVYDRDEHMRSKHSRQLEVIQKAQGTQDEIDEKTERQLDREATQAQTAAMLKLITGMASGAVPTEAPAIALDFLNTDGLRALADERGIELSDRRSADKMREEIEAAS